MQPVPKGCRRQAPRQQRAVRPWSHLVHAAAGGLVVPRVEVQQHVGQVEVEAAGKVERRQYQSAQAHCMPGRRTTHCRHDAARGPFCRREPGTQR